VEKLLRRKLLSGRRKRYQTRLVAEFCWRTGCVSVSDSNGELRFRDLHFASASATSAITLALASRIIKEHGPVLNNIARRINLRVRQAERGDHPLAPAFRRPERNEEHLVLVVINDRAQFGFEFNSLRRIQIALED